MNLVQGQSISKTLKI